MDSKNATNENLKNIEKVPISKKKSSKNIKKSTNARRNTIFEVGRKLNQPKKRHKSIPKTQTILKSNSIDKPNVEKPSSKQSKIDSTSLSNTAIKTDEVFFFIYYLTKSADNGCGYVYTSFCGSFQRNSNSII